MPGCRGLWLRKHTAWVSLDGTLSGDSMSRFSATRAVPSPASHDMRASAKFVVVVQISTHENGSPILNGP